MGWKAEGAQAEAVQALGRRTELMEQEARPLHLSPPRWLFPELSAEVYI